jgi:hypothetical protein
MLTSMNLQPDRPWRRAKPADAGPSAPDGRPRLFVEPRQVDFFMIRCVSQKPTTGRARDLRLRKAPARPLLYLSSGSGVSGEL